jgi:hypothetical protein
MLTWLGEAKVAWEGEAAWRQYSGTNASGRDLRQTGRAKGQYGTLDLADEAIGRIRYEAKGANGNDE